jgi:hypothetical protein
MEKPAEKRTVSITALFRRKAAKRYRCDKDLLDTLPNEIVAHIFTFLPIEEIGLLALVCKRFHHILQEDNEYFWKPLCNKWWHENGFHNHFTLEEVVNQAKEFQGRGWRWFAACFSHPCQEKEERDVRNFFLFLNFLLFGIILMNTIGIVLEANYRCFRHWRVRKGRYQVGK